MAVAHEHVSVGTTATKLDVTGDSDAIPGQSMLVRNTDASAVVYIGGLGVTTSTGFQLLAGESISVDLDQSVDLYAVVATGTVVCHILQVGV